MSGVLLFKFPLIYQHDTFCRSASLYLHKKQKQTDMAKLSQIRRLAILINKLSAVRYVPTDALIAHVENTLALYDNKDSNYSQRTMQRDFGLIDEMFGIVIRNDKSRGYYIAELAEMTDTTKNYCSTSSCSVLSTQTVFCKNTSSPSIAITPYGTNSSLPS